jgi:hypothetical protein
MSNKLPNKYVIDGDTVRIELRRKNKENFLGMC